jgi:ABC-type bacteriocin/lantibiotic exporter with double-glycine peptidase domain
VRQRISAYRRLFAEVRRPLTASIFISLAQSALLVPIPLLVKHIFDTELRRGHAAALAGSGAIVLALYLASAGLGLLTRYAVLSATKRAVAGLRIRLVGRLYALPRSYFDRRSLGELHAIVVQDSERVDIVANAAVGLLIPSVAVSFGLAIVALVLDPLLFGVMVAAVPLMWAVNHAFGKRVRAHTRAWQLAFDRFSARTQIALRALTLTRIQSAEEIELSSQSQGISELSDRGREMAWRQSASGILQGTIAAACGVLVLVIGGEGVVGGSLTVGGLISFYAIIALLQTQISTITSLVPLVIAGEESLQRLNRILDADEPLPYRGARKVDFQGAIELRAVSFGYGQLVLLRDLQLRLAPGEHVALMGANGAGKSTLVSLILGLYRPWSGALFADGVPYEEIDIRALRRGIGVVLQDPLTLPGTVAENIAYGRPHASRAEIARASELATAAEFIDQLDGGYEAIVGDDGLLLSGGQRQRLTIARALLAQPRLLIFDEPTTHLDESAIAALHANLAAMREGPTILTVTHDRTTASRADRVVRLEHGQLVGGVPGAKAAALAGGRR